MLLRDFYSIESFKSDETAVKADIKINAEHAIFKGHFPDNPIVPGVTMVQIVKEILGKSEDYELFLNKAINIKFMAILNPEEDPKVQVNITIKKREESMITTYSTITNEEKIFFKFSGQFIPKESN